MIPIGFIGWQSPLQPEPGDAIVIVVQGASQRFERGLARELAQAYGDAIVAWRRDEPLPAPPETPEWRAFPDTIPEDGQRVVALFLDAIGWRALSQRGELAERRFDRPAKALCVYYAAPPFGLFVDRRPLPGSAPCDDRRRWAAYAWRPALASDLTA